MNDDQSKDVVEAMEHFQMRAEKTIALEDLLATSNDIFKKVDINDLQALESRSRKYIDIAQARYDSGNISEHELLFHKCFAIESQIHEVRWTNGLYQNDLAPISAKMREVEKKHGLSDDEYWPISEAPKEYQDLSQEYDAIMEKKLLDAFVEFGSNDLKDLYVNDRQKFDQLHYIGGKSIFLKDEKSRLLSLAIIYENEAEVASKGGAFFAASVMLGSAIEARLIVTCLENEDKVRETLAKLGLTSKKLKSKSPLTWKLETLINVCCEAGWIPNFDTGNFTYNGQAMANFLRSTRNDVHPGGKAKKGSGLVMGGEQFKDIKYIHQFLASTLKWPNKQNQADT